ncbi:hypothetical protein BsWGS_06939 [Bradybaena similaris]
MKCSWTTLRLMVQISLTFSCLTVVECQKSQHLMLSEVRKTGLEGTLLQVNCTAHMTTALDSLRWIPVHEGQSGIQQTLVTNTTVVMTISSLQGSDAGRYKCLLIMADGTEETAEFELMVRRKEPNSAACSITQFKCKKTKHCIFLRYRCDGKDDCGDDSDEDCESNPCLNKFRCNNSRCIDNQEVCNHIDNCGDLSDEGSNCLFRVKMKRQREQRIARALEGMYQHGESREATSSGHGDEAPSDHRPFLPSASHHYGNIIVNVNNGVQYLPGYDYSLFVAVPPPYSECSGGDLKSQPPPYSTIDRSNTRQQTCVTAPSESQGHRQSISISSVQNYLAGVRGTDHSGTATAGRSDRGTLLGSAQANNGHLYPGGGHVQELESLSGITPRLLQSLLGSHCEASPDTDGYRNSLQRLPAQVDSWPHILQARVGVINSDSLSRQAPNTTSSSTQTSQHKPLVACRISPGLDTEAAMQGTHTENMLSPQNRFVAHNIQDTAAAEPDITVNVQSVSRGIPQTPVSTTTQIPVGTSTFCDTGPAATNSQCTCSALAETCGSDVDDLSVPLLAYSPEESVSARTSAGRLSSDSNNAAALTDCLLLMDTDTTSGCPAFVSEVSFDSQPRPSQVCGQNMAHPDDTLTLLVSAVGGITSPDHSALVCGTAMVRDENTIRLVSYEPTDGANVATKSSAHQPSYFQNEDTGTDQLSANSLSLQQSSIDKSLHYSLGVDAITTACESSSIANSKQPCSGELNIHNGHVVLEVSRHTPSSQILSRLHDVYAAEQRDMAQDGLEPVVNTKRPASVVTRPALPKFNSDFVLPYRQQPL